MMKGQFRFHLLIAVLALVVVLWRQIPVISLAAHEKLLLNQDFSDGMDDWWFEGAEKVWVEDGRLHVKADPVEEPPYHVATVWYRKPLPGNVRIEFDAHVVDSNIDANNINFFLSYSHPSGETMFETRNEREDASYRKYHVLNGYIFTFLNDFQGLSQTHTDGTTKARFRMRRCPGFKLVDEVFDYHCRKGVTYHIVITKQDGRLTYTVDGKTYLQWTDPEPLSGGMLGLRTFRTYLWWTTSGYRS